MQHNTAHIDKFTEESLPHANHLPTLDTNEYTYPVKLNVAVELTDRQVELGFGDKIALIGSDVQITYKQLSRLTNQIARVLVEDYGLVPGNRVLIRSGNCPMMVACWLGALKAGAVTMNTMSMMRTDELYKLIEKAKISFAFTERRIQSELYLAQQKSQHLKTIIRFTADIFGDAELNNTINSKPAHFDVVKTAQTDVALLASTSGTTGEPKITMHFHRDLMIIADGFAKKVLMIQASDICIGTPPLAFTFGLGGLAIFPLRFGAATVLREDVTPLNLSKLIDKYKATICFTAPTAYRAMLSDQSNRETLKGLRCAVSAGETLPAPVHENWSQAVGVPIIDALGSTEALHVFVCGRLHDSRPGSTGTALDGYEVRIFDDQMNELKDGSTGNLAFRGPTGCRYLNDERQKKYVRNGWNMTGDLFYRDKAGQFHFVSRSDEMIISSGYNIAGPEVEAALLTHPEVMECAVVAAPDKNRGSIVQAHVVLFKNIKESVEIVNQLQNHVKKSISPYKYPRSIVITKALPKTRTGKIKRFLLRQNSYINT